VLRYYPLMAQYSDVLVIQEMAEGKNIDITKIFNNDLISVDKTMVVNWALERNADWGSNSLNYMNYVKALDTSGGIYKVILFISCYK